MKYFGTILATGLTLLVLLIVGIFSFLPASQTDQTAVKEAGESPALPAAEQVIAPAVADPTRLEAMLAEREATYQRQIETLNQAIQEHRTTYQTQIQELTNQIATAQNQLNELKTQEQNVMAQTAQLETARAERLAAYQAQLENAQNQFNERSLQLQGQLNEARTKLSEANAQLGR